MKRVCSEKNILMKCDFAIALKGNFCYFIAV